MKLCINCKHFSLGKCARPKKQKISLVDGEDITHRKDLFCGNERYFINFLLGGCGPWGRYFEPIDKKL